MRVFVFRTKSVRFRNGSAPSYDQPVDYQMVHRTGHGEISGEPKPVNNIVVMIVDDDEPIRDEFESILKAAGFRFRGALR